MLFRGFLIIFGLYSSVGMADAYRCVEGGKVVISNIPCVATRVIQSDNPSSESVYQANRDLERQRGYLAQRSADQREYRRSAQLQAEEFDRMYPVKPEPVKSSSTGITFPGCGFGGSCSTSRTTRR